jgi:hypothetical protein
MKPKTIKAWAGMHEGKIDITAKYYRDPRRLFAIYSTKSAAQDLYVKVAPCIITLKVGKNKKVK